MGYRWPPQNPLRRVFDNIAVTTPSVALAIIVATVLLLQTAARALGFGSGFWARCTRSTSAISRLGMVAVSIVVWAGAAIVWKKRIHPKERT